MRGFCFLLKPVNLQWVAATADTGGMNSQSPRVLNRPRHYAALIVQAAGDVALQRQIFEACPFEMRAQVRDLTKLALYHAEKVLEHKRMIQRARENDPAPNKPTLRVSSLKRSDSAFGQQRLAELRAAVGGGV